MKTSIYSRHRFHPDVIRKTLWLYFRFNLSFRDIESMMAERSVDVSYETIRRWVDKFGLIFAKSIKRRLDKPSTIWHLDEVFVRIDVKLVYLWWIVDDEGTVLDIGGHKNNRAQCSHVPIRRRERKTQRSRSIRSAQNLLSAHGPIYNLFNIRRHLTSRNTMKILRNRAMANWDISYVFVYQITKTATYKLTLGS